VSLRNGLLVERFFMVFLVIRQEVQRCGEKRAFSRSMLLSAADGLIVIDWIAMNPPKRTMLRSKHVLSGT
jgi:hypothetical protein